MYPASPPWLAFVPYHVAYNLIENPTANLIGYELRFEAVVLFADISGFTAISEALGKTGKQGTEELTTILNSYFEPMIELIVSYGGIIVKFGGDALTVLFPVTDLGVKIVSDDNRKSAVQRAIQCAIKMQAKMPYYSAIATSAGIFDLVMKAGLALGPVFCTTVGNFEPIEKARLEYLIAGQVLDLCAEAEHYASKGEIIVHNALLPYAAQLEIVAERGAFSCVANLNPPAKPLPLPPLPLEHVTTDLARQIAFYLHPSLAQRLNAGQSSFINEHRKVTILFASFSGFDYDNDPSVGQTLQAYLAQVITIIQNYDGYLNKVDMGDKGSKYIVLFGAPVAHEDDEKRALLCALELLALGSQSLRVGINTGFVYCGQVGSALRQEYTVMGDAVNLAARLMEMAKPNQIIVSGFTYSYVPASFSWQDFAPVQVKGKSEPVAIYGLLGADTSATIHLQQPSYKLPMVGREKELQLISAKLLAAKAGQGQIVAITAEAGIGKSRLVAEVVRQANREKMVIYGGECQSYRTNISYLVWQPIWQAFFGLDPDSDITTNIKQLEQQLAAIDENLVQRLPLLSAMLNLPLPENNLTQSLDPKIRKASLESMLVTCLTHRAKSTPIMLVLEDCHWIDALSYDLLEAINLALNTVPVLLVLAYRPSEPGKILFANLAKQSGIYWTKVPLQDFTPAEAQLLIALKLRQLFELEIEKEVTAPVAALVARVTEQSQGNPFYIEELINLLQDKGIAPYDTKALEQLELPDSLYSLVISRIDQLAESEKIVLKVASIIGRSFRLAWVIGVQPQLGTAAQVKLQLDNLSRLAITTLDKPEPELEYLFKHIITKDVAYESLAFATRQHLHELTGQFIEQTFSDNLNSYLDLLAFHYGQSTNQAKQRQYFELAADAAATNYANEDAIAYYHRLLPLLPDAEKIAVVLKQGEILRLIGKMDEAEAVFRQALQFAENSNDAGALARSQNALGKFFWYRSQFNEAIVLLEEARQGFEDLHDEAGLSQAIGDIGLVYWRQSDYLRALECYEYQLQTATKLNNQKNVVKALMNIGIVYAEQNDFLQSKAFFERQLEVARQADNQQGISEALGNLAIVYANQEDYSQAYDYFNQQLHIASKIGDRRGISLAVGNIGEVYRLQGNYSQAFLCQQQKLQMMLELGEQNSVAFSLINLAIISLALASYEATKELIERAISLTRSLNLPYRLCECLQVKADLLTRQGHFQSAVQYNDEALALATRVGNKEYLFKAQLLAIRLRLNLLQTDKFSAQAEFEKMLVDWHSKAEQASLYYQLSKLAISDDTTRRYQQQALELYRELYHKTSNIEYRKLYQELKDSSLPDLPTHLVLLPSSRLLTQKPVSLQSLLAQIDAKIVSLSD